MSALPKPMTIDDFLSWEEKQELRYEYDGVAVQAMTGGTVLHVRQDAAFADPHEQIGADGALNMPEIGLEVPLAEIYEGVPSA